MTIILAEHYGLCFGVRDAIAQAKQLATNTPLTVLGELVHNPVVHEQLSESGVRTGELERVGTSRTLDVMITAHGASDAAREAWKSAGFKVADGTCPLVRHAHTQLRMLVEKGFHPVIIGKHGHVEVRGLAGDFPQATILECEQDLAHLPSSPRYGVISQTTQTTSHVQKMVAAVKNHRPEAEVVFRDTICQPTKDRQRALQQLLARCDTVVVVGGPNSNNTLALVAAVKAAGLRALHVSRASELVEEDFIGSSTVGVTAGTSSLKETVAEVVKWLEGLSKADTTPPDRATRDIDDSPACRVRSA